MLRKNLFNFFLAFIILFTSSCTKDQDISVLDTSRSNTLVDKFSHQKSKCLSDKKMMQLYEKMPNYQSEIQKGREKIMHQMLNFHSRSMEEKANVTIPVHVIIVHHPDDAVGQGTNLGQDRIYSQLEALNRDFLRENTDANNTPAVFSVSNSGIQFCFAKIDPAGNPSNGITRYSSTENFDENEISIKSKTTWKPEAYLNIWVAPNIDGLGYAYLPSPTTLPLPEEDGVVIITQAFGGPNSGAEAPFDLGRTVTHEVGHYLGLDHIWGDGCQLDDGIADTPQQAQENYDCPSHPSPSCGNSGDMFMNYMDYTNDDCLNAFTQGQTQYMRHILETSRNALIQPGKTECNSTIEPTGPKPSCTDGIRNGMETGVDCGGPDCNPCSETVTIDVGITNLSLTSSDPCAGQNLIMAEITNFGPATLKQVEILVTSQDNQILLRYPWVGNLPPSQKAAIPLPAIVVSEGQHHLTVSTLAPNNESDSDPSNDNKTINLTGGSGYSHVLKIKPDEFASDIIWYLEDEQGNVLYTGGEYEDGNTTMIVESFCLPEGCYDFIIIDTFGDGLCCEYGEGHYRLEDAHQNIVFESDGFYGESEIFSFCQDGQSSSLKDRKRAPKPPAAQLRSGKKKSILRTN